MTDTPYDRALRCLAHPATWTAIAVLVVNDHVLKHAAPSLLTGKLSDLAGLFFFPFLVAAVVALVGPPGLPRSVVGRGAFATTALWFAGIKLVPAANALTASAVSALVGGPARIALDPTDLIALAMLWPAWRLWNVPARVPAAEVTRRRTVETAALAAAALATMATSPTVLPSLERLAVDGRIVYASVVHFYPGPADDLSRGSEVAWRSMDGGRTWDQEGSYPTQWRATGSIRAALDAPRSFPVMACAPDAPWRCFRSAAAGQVEISADGGMSWRREWGLPRERLEFMRRAASSRFFRPGPLDLVILSAAEGERVVVAMGSEGVAVRAPDGSWSQHSVGLVEPAASRATSAEELLGAIEPEFWVAILTSAAIGLLLSRRAGRRGGIWAVIVGGAVLLLTQLPGSVGRLDPATLVAAFIYGYGGPIVGLAAGIRAASAVRSRGQASSAAAIVLDGVALSFLVAWLPFGLWAAGLIAVYAAAVAVAVAGCTVVLAWGVRRIDGVPELG